jgi:hypothetical protein
VDPKGESDYGDPASPAGDTITSTYRLGRVLTGVPLALFVFIRQMAWGGFDDELAPSYLHLSDRPTGRNLRISLGRDPVEVERIRLAIERDLLLLTRAQFIEQWAPDWQPPDPYGPSRSAPPNG